MCVMCQEIGGGGSYAEGDEVWGRGIGFALAALPRARITFCANPPPLEKRGTLTQKKLSA